MTPAAASAHVAHFFDDDGLTLAVVPHLAAGLEPRTRLVLVSSSAHRDRLLQGLGAAVGSLAGRVAWYDAETTLRDLMVGGEPDAARFRDTVGRLIEEQARLSPTRLLAYGEMVSLLARERQFAAAVRLEQLWNELLNEWPLSLCCAYDAAAFGPDDTPAFREVIALHRDVLPGPGWEALIAPADRRRAVELEHAARLARHEASRRRIAEEDRARMGAAGAALARSLASEAPAAHGGDHPLMIWSSGTDARCDYFNGGWLDFTGRTMADELGDGWAEGVHPDDLARCVLTYRTAFERREPFRMEYRLRRADGAYRLILDAGTPRLDERSAFLGYIGGCIDVTDLRAAQQRRDTLHATLERVAQEWARAFDSLDLGVFVLDGSRVVRRLNRAGLRLTGATRYEDVIGRDLEQLGGPPPWDVAREMAASSARGAPAARPVRSPTDGRSWDVGAAPLVTEEGTSGWTIVTLRDTTEVTRLQEALRHSENMAALGAIVGGVAHEVRNPLCGISATVQLFESRLGDRPELRDCAAMLNGNVQRLLELMQELLDYARPVSPAFAPAALAEVVEEAVRACRSLAEQREVTVECAVPADLPPLRVDRRRLVQVFHNVVSNAVAFSPPRSTVRVRAHAEADSVRSEIEDSGGGFAPEEIARVFDPFFTRRRDGTGLGLSIARRIVEAHGGGIAAANRPGGGGALLTITLPRSHVRPPGGG